MRINYNAFLEIDINTGKFYYTSVPKFSRIIIGKEAGCNKSGYVIVDQKPAHKIFFELIIGNTNYEIDHINGIRNDNRPENLRLVTSQENSWNGNINSKSYIKNDNTKNNSYRVCICDVPELFHNKMKLINTKKNDNQYKSKSMTEKECIELVTEIKSYFKDRLNKILTLRQIIDTLNTSEWWLP